MGPRFEERDASESVRRRNAARPGVATLRPSAAFVLADVDDATRTILGYLDGEAGAG